VFNSGLLTTTNTWTDISVEDAIALLTTFSAVKVDDKLGHDTLLAICHGLIERYKEGYDYGRDTPVTICNIAKVVNAVDSGLLTVVRALTFLFWKPFC
jgi:hypothetical protein